MNSTYKLALNTWLPVAQTWKPQLPVAESIASKFLFHFIRPLVDMNWASNTFGNPNQIQRIAARQVFCISRVGGGVFVCASVTDEHLDKFNLRYRPCDYDSLLANRKAATWHLPIDNFFTGQWEAFNGPNPIDITK